MTERTGAEYLCQQISTVARQDAVALRKDLTIQQAFEEIRAHGLGERIVYFYVVNDDHRLVGVIPTRRLFTASSEQRLCDIMITEVLTIPESATILDAHEMMARHKLLALPVVDPQNHLLGVVDVGMFLDEDLDVAERERVEEVFENIGFRVSQLRDASPFKAFRFRFPWLLASIGSGTICAVLASVYELTLAKSLVLAFFLTVVLGLSESVSMQSMTVAIHALRRSLPTLRWYAGAIRREVGTAFMLGAACGLTVGSVAWLWRGEGWAALAIGGGIASSICAAALFGLSVPTLLHTLRLDPKIAAGPVTLAITDMCTVLLYFSLAAVLL